MTVRIRSIKPEFWRSLSIAELSVEDRLLFIGLWSYVDDNGVGVDQVAIIAADLFALDLESDPRETFARVSRGLQHLFAAGRIVRYTVENRDYLAIVNWSEHQRIDRPNKPRLPEPTSENAIIRESVARVSRESIDWNRGTGEQRNRGTEDKYSSSSATPLTVREPDRFEEFWKPYPRKVGKDDARKAWKSAKRRTDQQSIIDGSKRLATDPNLPEKQFIPHPATWLRRGGWNDEPLPPRTHDGMTRSGKPTTDDRVRAHLTLAQQLAAEEDAQQRLEITS